MPAVTANTTYYFVAWNHVTGGTWVPGTVLNFTTLGIAPLFTSSPVTSATMGSSYTYAITTTGTPNAAITATTSLPTGLTFTDNGNGTATISGTPTVSGVFPIGLHATNSGGPADQSYVLTIINPCDGWTLEGCSAGTVNGQDSWKSTGSFDQGVVANDYGFPTFGAKTFRISNAITSGSFGDQTFVKPAANEAGETDASNHGVPVGTRKNHFVEQFDIASAMPTQQAGLSISVSPDRGDGSRMSYLRFDDNAGGIDVTFYDTPGVSNPANFNPTLIATLDRTVPHTIKFDMTFVDGPNNDIVKIYIDGTLVHTGTTWENYYRYDSESSAEQAPRAISTLIIRAGGTAAPATSGKGYLFDNFSLTSDTVSLTPSSSTSTTIIRIADLDAGPNAAAMTNASGKWFMYNDSTDVIDNTLGVSQVGPGSAPAGVGSFRFTLAASPNDREDIATYAYSGVPLSEITKLSYSAYSHSGVAGASESPYFVMNVDFTGNSGSWQKRLAYVPSNNGPVPQDQWNTFDTINGGTGMWVYSGATWPTTSTGPDAGVVGAAGTTARSWSAIRADYPSIRILPTGGLIGVRVGEPGPTAYQGDVDKITVATSDGTTAVEKTYDFEPTLSSDLAVTKTVDKPSPNVGDTVTYTITVTNKTGSDDAYGVSVSDILPSTLSFVSTSSADTIGVYSATTGVWSVGSLAASSTATLHITATVLSSALATTVSNTASVSDSHSTDPLSNDNTATAIINVLGSTSSNGGGGGGGGGNGPISGSLPGVTNGGDSSSSGNTGSGSTDSGSTGQNDAGNAPADTGTTDNGGNGNTGGNGGGNGSPELGLGNAGGGTGTTSELAAAAAALGLGSTSASSSQLAAAGSLFGNISPYLWWILLLLILGGSWWYYWYLGRNA
jgi:uncharacterized repeat protein (TIGR01451 family)